MRLTMDSDKSTVLIVDDEQVNQLLLENILKPYYNILLASDGEEACRVIREYAQNLSLVLLDLGLPKKNGREVLQEMKADPVTQNIPVIMVTSQTDVEEEMLSHGAADFLGKPYNNPRVILARVANIIALNESVKIINAQSNDVVTGLFNMRRFLKDAGAGKDELMREQSFDSHAIVYLNLTGFKHFNTKYGIEAGDQCLRSIAGILQQNFPDTLMSRFSDDHFVVLAKRENLETACANVVQAIEDLGLFSQLHGKVGVKYITAKEWDHSISSICDMAKTACDTIKHNMAQAIAIFDDHLGEELRRRIYIIENLDKAMEQGRIKVFFQPVIRALSGELCGAEALVRWIDPELGFLSPGEFIPVLEDAHLIHKLDSFMIRQICMGYRKSIHQNIPVVPVSFNLSRLDFILTDIGKVILDAVEEYQVPRNMLKIEITESMFVRNAEHISKEIARFHKEGFKVWMDDFGSGYSSLNVLKDYDFDELKIDMLFLSDFSERSKNILRSIVRMAKDIGIQTLAEGVETKEQFEFLRSIGCEKIQGYYFGKPEPCETCLRRLVVEEGMRVETTAMAEYYDEVGKINFLTDQPLAIMEDDGEQMRFLFVNTAYQEVLNSNGTTSAATAQNNVNRPGSPLRDRFRKLMNSIQISGREASITYPSGDSYMSATITPVARCNGKQMLRGTLVNLSKDEDKEQKSIHELFLRNMLYLYDMYAFIDYRQNTVEFFDTQLADGSIGQKECYTDIAAVAENYRRAEVYPDDHLAFKRLLDAEKLPDNIRNSKDGFVSDYFRIKIADGTYAWHNCTVLPILNGSGSMYLLLMKKVAFENRDILRRLANVYVDEYTKGSLESHTEDTFNAEVLWHNLKNYSDAMYFWKDKDRRFRGVSQSFLDYFGLESEEDVIGKTDEEMNWHVSDGPFMDDEKAIITTGKRTTDIPGKCIIKGVLHNILASKMPIYRGGEIVGLFGYCVDVERDNRLQDAKDLISTTDLATGLANSQGVMANLLHYIEEFKMNGTDYAVIHVSVKGVEEFIHQYGAKAGDALLHQIGQELVGHGNVQVSAGRLVGGSFVLLYRKPEQGELTTYLARMKSSIQALTHVVGHPCSLFAQISCTYAADFKNPEDMMISLFTEKGLME